MHSSASQHILPLLPLFSPAWGNVLTSYHRHTCGPLQSDMPGSTHTHRGREGWDPHTNTFTCSYCSLWPVMELTHCLIWSVWNHCLTSLVKMGALGWEVEGCNIKAEVDWRRKGRVIREWTSKEKWPQSHLDISMKEGSWDSDQRLGQLVIKPNLTWCIWPLRHLMFTCAAVISVHILSTGPQMGGYRRWDMAPSCSKIQWHIHGP